jgi:2-polyprenyl-6-methoxyphenol hydroxylase-like FAD-dependent oxidoreductase
MGGMLIVGAGLAGLTVAETLRAEGYAGPVTLLGAEPHAPYQRPPLSKGFLLGETAEAQLMMRTAEMLMEKRACIEESALASRRSIAPRSGSRSPTARRWPTTASRCAPAPACGRCRWPGPMLGRRVRPALAG